MKKFNQFLSIAILLVVVTVIISGCKKKTEDPVPAFTISADTVPLTGGGTGVQFFAKCTNNGVTMTNVTITNPASGFFVHNFNGASYVKNAIFPLQGTNEAYPKLVGSWQLNLVGKSAGGTDFAIDATYTVSQ